MVKGMAKRVFSAVMAASLLFSCLGTTNLVMAEESEETGIEVETQMPESGQSEEQTTEAEVLQTEAAKYRIVLPKYEEMDYRYEDSKLDTEYMTGSAGDHVRAALLYEAGETVEFSIIVGETYQPETIELIDEAKQKQNFDWKDNTIKFVMPEKDLKLSAAFMEVAETEETSLVSENNPEETSGNDPPAEQETAIDSEIVTGEAGMAEDNDSVIATEETSETAGSEETTYTENLEEDGLPKQGSIVQAENVQIPFDTWDFDAKNDYTNISYAEAGYQIEYVSDDIVYDAAGTYSTIYKVTEPVSGKFWFVLRPVIVMSKEEMPEVKESEHGTAEEEDQSEESTEALSEASDGTELDLPDTLVYYSPEVDEPTAEAIEEHDEMIMLSMDEIVFEEAEEAEVMLLAASPKTVKSKTFTGKNLIDSMTGINRVTNYDFGSTPNAYNSFSVALSKTAKGDIESFLSANGSEFDDKWSKITVSCGDSNHERLGWMNGKSQLSNATMKVTLYDTDGDTSTIEKVKVALTLTPTGYSWVGASYFQTMVGSKYYTTTGSDGTLRIAKKSDCTAAWLGRTTSYYVSTTFAIYDAAACGEDDLVATTQLQNDKDDADRTATSDVTLPEGTYWIKEISRSPGHQNPTGTIYGPFEVKTGETTDTKGVLGDYIVNYGIFAGLNLTKKENAGNAVPECIFKVTGTCSTLDDGATFTWFFKTDANGEIHYDASHLVQSYGGVKSDALFYPKGKSNDAMLPMRMTLNITEVSAPEEYVMDTTTHTVKTGTPSADASGILPTFYTVALDVTNDRKEVSVEISKKDDVRGTNLSGAVYGIYKDEACSDANKVAELPATDANGYAKASFIADQETYYLKEITAPQNYAINVNATGIKVAYGTTTSSAQTDQEVMGQIVMYKEGEVLTGISGSEGAYEFTYTTQKLPGATFRVTAAENILHADGTVAYQQGDLIGDYVTGADGSVTTEQLPLGNYTVTEIAAPADYINDHKSVNVALSFENQTVTVVTASATITNSRQKADISVEKKDEDTQNPLSGGMFGLYAGNDITDVNGNVLLKKDSFISKVTTAGDGKAVFTADLPIGNSYYVKEVTAPNGYVRNTEDTYSFEFKYTDDETKTQTFSHTFTNKRVRAQINLIKVDKETGKQVPQGGASLSGAVYGLYARENIVHPDGATGILYQKDEKVAEFPATDDKGETLLENLYLGKYYVKEITPAEGYLLDEEEHDLNCSYEGDQVPNVKREAISEEQVIRGSLSLMKYLDDSVDQSILQDWIKRKELKGISFTLRSEDETQDIITITTDKYGYAATEEKALVYGKWYLEEVADTTPEGYQGLQETEIEISENEEELKYVVTNKMLSWQVRIVKKDADTGNVVPLSGAKFQILDQDGNVMTMRDNLNYRKYTDVFTTDEEGMIELTQPFKIGIYTVQEIEAPDGYLITEPVSFELKDERQTETKLIYTVEYPDNPQMGQIQVTKLDTETKEPAGAGFTYEITAAADILDASGAVRSMMVDGKETTLTKDAVVAIITTDEIGMAVSPKLYLGEYAVKEIASGEYYAVSEERFPVSITYDQKVETVEVPMTVENRKTTFELYKVDADESSFVLEGITFRMFSTSDRDAEKARLIAEKVAELRTQQEALRDDFCSKQAEALEVYQKTEGVTREQIMEYVAGQEQELAHYWASLEAQQKALETQLMEELEVTDVSALGNEYITDAQGRIHVEELLHGNTYFIYETATIPGYNLDTTIHEFTVDEKGLIDGKDTYIIEIANKANLVDISKVDVTGEQELPGAELTITASDGTLVDQWISTEEPHRVKGLAAGEYTLTEVQAPSGYAIADSIIFTLTDSLEVQKVVMKDELIQVQISKKDITNEEELPGATLVVTNEDGTVMDEWISEEEPHFMNLPIGNYTLKEIIAPAGYVRASEVAFEVLATGEVQKVSMVDDVTKVQISKHDLTNEEELPGASLVLKDAEDQIIDEWVSSAEAHYIEKLPVGTYTLTETTAPDGYVTAETVTFEVLETAEVQTVVMKDDVTKIQITKTDLVSGEPVIGATLTIMDETGKTAAEWVTTEEPYYIEKLPAGAYTLKETKTPTEQGYVTAEDIAFVVEDTGEIQKIEMKDDHTKVEISKKDITNDKELPGAKLTVKDSDGKTVEEWTSKKEAHLMEQLPTGKYTLTEVTAPNGYEVAETVEFEVTDTMEIQHVTMYDAPKDSTIDLTGMTSESTPGTPSYTSGTPISNLIASAVQTGDFNRFVGVLILLAVAVLSGCGYLCVRKKNKKEK